MRDHALAPVLVARKPETDPSQELRANETLLIGEMSKFGIPVSEARRLLKQYGDEKIRTAVAYTAARVAQKNAQHLSIKLRSACCS